MPPSTEEPLAAFEPPPMHPTKPPTIRLPKKYPDRDMFLSAGGLAGLASPSLRLPIIPIRPVPWA